MVECPSCHTSNPPESRLCSKCSTPFGIDSATLVEGASPSPSVDSNITQVFSEVSLAATAIGGTGWSVPLQQSGASSPAPLVEVGAILGERYEILKRLGEGGMGAVYKARDHELDRLVALKVIRPELAGHPDILRRFKQELILARQVTHKNVVRIFDLGSADGRKFITMDYIEGQDLKSILVERGKLPPSEVVPIFQQICRGLEAAHVEGVVHRDLKPQNIMVDDAKRVWLMDFGLARSMEMAGMTRTGVLMGTPDYMSPEQARAEKVDARSDLFSLGIIVYEMLVGHLPFQADTLMAKLLKRVQQRAKPVTEIDPKIPAPLGAIVMKCLEPDVAKRYQSVREILDDLSGTGPASQSQAGYSQSQLTSAGVSAGSAEATSLSLAALGPGSQFGPRYRIESEIGEGGMGKVYKAYDSDLDRTVALKLVRPELARDASSLQRFKQELLLASRISHRNILRIHDLGDVGGVKFISMAYIQGMDLHDLIVRMGKLPTERVVNIAKQLASALEAAHAEGVVHRDLKPRNVLITVEDHVYVSDFGLAKSLDAETTAMTRAGEVLGTPRYMSPEQAESKAADHRSDLYSLGVILYEMATGEVPFTGESSLQVMFQHVQQPPKDPRLVNPDIPEYLALVIMKCLEKDPALRYQNAAELLRDLESGTPPTRIVRLRIAETGYSKWMFAAMGIVLLVGIGLAVRPVRERVLVRSALPGVLKKPGTSSPGVDDKFIALIPLRVLGNDAALHSEAEGVVEALSAKLSPMKNVHLAATGAVEKINAADPVAKIARQLGSKLIVQGTMQSGAADKIDVALRLTDASGKQLWTKDFSGVRQDLLTIEDQIYNELVTALELKPSDEESARNALRPTENVGAYELYLKGRDILRGKRDVKRVESAVDLYQQAIQKDSSFALAYAGLSDASLVLYNLNQDANWSQKALSAAQHAQTLNDQIPEVHFALGNAYRATGKTNEAIVELKRALELAPNSDEGYRRLGDAYLAAGKTDDAIQAYQQAIDANPYYWLNQNKLGSVYFQLGQKQKALDAFERVVQLAPDNGLGYENIGVVNFQAGKWNDAITAYGKALKIEPSENLYINLGVAYLNLGHRADAISTFQKAVALNPNDHEALGDLGEAYRQSGNAVNARAEYDKAIALALKALRVNPQDASTLGDLAYYYAKNGDSTKALEFIRRARSIDANDNELMYKEAVINAMAGRQPEALSSLRAALQKGYSVEQAKNDPELKALAANPELNKLIAGFDRKTN